MQENPSLANVATLNYPTQINSSIYWLTRPTPCGRGASGIGIRTVACLVTSSSPVPLKTRSVEQRCTLNLSRLKRHSRWCGVVVRRGVPPQVSSTS
ncbi:hypothetical protein TNCV_1593771 [Trichonephila clavipes]|nr:hypothetical protein TNCV_1593771 [Trichonephila clavipes]